MVETIAPYVRSVTPSSLQAKMQATNMLRVLKQIGDLSRETLDLRRRVDELQLENAALRAQMIPSDPKIAARMAPIVLNQFVDHLASELDKHAKAFDWIKGRMGNLVAWERDELRPFCHAVDNRLKFLEMMIEGFADANPDVRQKFERIHQVIGRVDYSRPDPQTAPAPPKDDAR